MSFAENLKKLPKVSHLAALNLLDDAGQVVASIENTAGTQSYTATYHHAVQT